MPGGSIGNIARRLRELLRGPRTLAPLVFASRAPLDFRLAGRALSHAALVGLTAGLVGAAFFAALEYVSSMLLEGAAGYAPVRAQGEQFATWQHHAPFRPWLLVILPALGGLGAGLVARYIPEVRGGGSDPTIEAFHYRGGMLRRRLIWAKPLASILSLGTGGAGGREGPTMLIGAAIGSTVARVLGLSVRERRILLVAGIAAGISAVFRTPLGAALLAVELLYRDGFESDALIPSVLASVTAYSVVISIFGESTLFTHAPRFPFVPAHLPLYGLLAFAIAVVAIGFLAVFGTTRRLFSKLPGPDWIRPALGGLALGVLATAVITFIGGGGSGRGFGILGGGYGAVQAAISGADWLPLGWTGVLLLLGLSLVKVFAASLTIGSGGSAGDFAPSLAIGGLLGGAFGRAAQIVLADPRIDPGAFALVGMGAFYGGIAHVPLASLVLVCELAGNYDLLVPLMLTIGIAFVALRHKGIYEAQVDTLADSPVHRDAVVLDMLRAARVGDVMLSGRPFVSFASGSTAREVIDQVGDADWQNVFPVVDAEQRLIGLVTSELTHVLAQQADDTRWTIVADLMQPAVALGCDDDLHAATKLLIESGLREIPVVDADRRVIGFLDEADIAKLHLQSADRAET